MTKKEIITTLKIKMQAMPKSILLNLLEVWEGRTPKLWCEPSEDCFECRFPEERVCDEKDCDGRIINT